MSYSYLKAVFPRFENSKIYDDRIYASLDSNGVNNKFLVKANENKKEYTQLEDKNIRLESFTNSKKDTIPDEHEMYMEHVLKCEKCLEIISRQLKIDNERVIREEVIELIAFIAFGVFMLMLIDKTRK
jgi:hypothetical protein